MSGDRFTVAMSLLEVALLTVIEAALLPYVLGPVLVRFTQRQPVRWDWVPYDAGRPALPAGGPNRP